MSAQLERDASSIPSSVGPYRILDRLGEGGMGVVYRATLEGAAAPVAIKTIARVKRKMLAALRSEVLALRQVNHPGVVRILDEGLNEENPWYAMELVDGPTVDEFNAELWAGDERLNTHTTSTFEGVVSGSRPDLREYSPSGRPLEGGADRPQAAGGRLAGVLDIYRRLCAPLSHIHERALVHRDIKPSNVVLRGGDDPVLMDFGLASRILGAGTREALDFGERFLGSAPYVSPEQIRGEFVDARADLYSLGCMMYESVTGQTPFTGRSVTEILEKHLHDAPAAPSVLVRALPPALDQLILSLLEKRAHDRTGYAEDVALALRDLGAAGPLHEVAEDRASSLPSLYRPEFVGHADVLSVVGRHRQAAIGGSGALLFVVGESGIGKTLLAAEVARQAALERFQVIVGECRPVETDSTRSATPAPALHPFRRFFQLVADRCREGGQAAGDSLIAPYASVLAGYEPSIASLVAKGTPPLPRLPPDAARQLLLTAMTDLLSRVAATGPTLLILDDLQWADELSLAVLRALPVGFFSERRLLLVGLVRSDEPTGALESVLSRPDSATIRLDRLGAAEIGAMVGDMLAVRNPPESLIRFLTQESEGNPFFVVEYLRLAAAEGVVVREAGRWKFVGEPAMTERFFERRQLPLSVQQMVEQRLGELDERDRAVLEAAAVLGREFDDELLVRVARCSGDDLALALRGLAVRQIIEPSGSERHRFLHDKLREVCYSRIPRERVAVLHHAAGDAVELTGDRDRHLAELARHFEIAGEQEKSVRYLERAAFQALSRFANHEAASFFGRLLSRDRARPGAEPALQRARWERGLGDALHGIGEMESSRDHLASATALLGHPVPRTQIGMVASMCGQLVRQVAHRVLPAVYRRGVEIDQARFREASQAYDRLLQIAYYTGRSLDMFHATLNTLNLAERGGDSPELAMAYSIAHAVAGVMPLRRLADFYLERANQALAAAYEPAVESYLQLLAAVYRSGLGDWTAAKIAVDRGLEIANQLGFGRRRDELELAHANWAYLQGRFALARERAALSAPARGDSQAQAWQALMLAQVRLVQGDDAGAAQLLRQLEELVPKLQRSELAWYWALHGVARLRGGQRPAARDAAEAALREILKGPPITFYCIEAYAWTADTLIELWQAAIDAGEPSDALGKLAGDACVALKQFARVFPSAEPRADLTLGRRAWIAQQPRVARALLDSGRRRAEQLAMAPDLARAHWWLGRTAPTQQERESRLGAALEIASDVEAWNDVEAITLDLTRAAAESGSRVT